MLSNRAVSALLSGAGVTVAVARWEKAVRVKAVPCVQGGGHAGDDSDCGTERPLMMLVQVYPDRPERTPRSNETWRKGMRGC